MAKIFNVPFATTGQREDIPDSPDPDNYVSYADGYTVDYALDPEVDPSSKDIERTKFNGILHDITEAIFELQRHGVAAWSADAAPYPVKARVYFDGAIWSSTVGNNNQTPGAGSNWALNEILFSSQAQALVGENNSTAMTPLRVHQAFNQYGIGAHSQEVPGGDIGVIDNSIPPGLYRITAATVGAPFDFGSLLHMRRDSGGGESQLAISDTTDNLLLFRRRASGAWGGWREVTTAQSTTVPAGVQTALDGKVDKVGGTIDGFKPHLGSQGPSWGDSWPTIKAGGTLEIGRYIDFHPVSDDTTDYSVRLDGGAAGSSTLTVNGSLAVTGVIYGDARRTTVGSQVTVSTSSNFIADHQGRIVYVNAASVTLTIPQGVFPDGSVIFIFSNQGAATTPLIAAGAGVNLARPPSRAPRPRESWSMIGIVNRGGDNWSAFGDLADA